MSYMERLGYVTICHQSVALHLSVSRYSLAVRESSVANLVTSHDVSHSGTFQKTSLRRVVEFPQIFSSLWILFFLPTPA